MNRQRAVFCVIAAIVAAALADPLMEFASNAGFFGNCNCTDHSNLADLPALCVSLLLAIGLLAYRIRYVLTGRSPAAPVTWRFLPAIFAIQISVLYAMESVEQVVVSGHTQGGTIWLGGPPAISLAVHAACAILATFAIARALCASTKTVIRIYLRLAAAMGARSPRRMLLAQLRFPASFRRSSPLICRIGERAPPPVTV